jgi:hypothetical protein
MFEIELIMLYQNCALEQLRRTSAMITRDVRYKRITPIILDIRINVFTSSLNAQAKTTREIQSLNDVDEI